MGLFRSMVEMFMGGMAPPVAPSSSVAEPLAPDDRDAAELDAAELDPADLESSDPAPSD